MKDLIIARISKPFGLKGELRVVSMTSFPELRFKVGYEYALGEGKTPAVLKSVRPAGGTYVMSFDGIDSIDKAEQLVGRYCLVRKADLPEGWEDLANGGLAGYAVVDEELGALGAVDRLVEMPAQALLAVTLPGGLNFIVGLTREVGQKSLREDRVLKPQIDNPRRGPSSNNWAVWRPLQF